jgi:hypothetical protein
MIGTVLVHLVHLPPEAAATVPEGVAGIRARPRTAADGAASQQLIQLSQESGGAGPGKLQRSPAHSQPGPPQNPASAWSDRLTHPAWQRSLPRRCLPERHRSAVQTQPAWRRPGHHPPGVSVTAIHRPRSCPLLARSGHLQNQPRRPHPAHPPDEAPTSPLPRPVSRGGGLSVCPLGQFRRS